MNQADISVVTPLYNETREVFKPSIQSLFNQTLLPREIILVLDNPENLKLKEYILSLNHEVIDIRTMINDKNRGAAYSRNRAIREAKGNFIAFHDGDDISLPNRFELQYAYFQKNPTIQVLGTAIEYKDLTLDKTYMVRKFEANIHQVIKRGTPIANPSAMIRKQVFDMYGYFDENLQTTNEDYELWIRWYSHQVSFSNLQDVCVVYNQRLDSFKYRNTKLQLWSTVLLKWKYKSLLKIGILDYLYLGMQVLLLLLPNVCIVKLFFFLNKKS